MAVTIITDPNDQGLAPHCITKPVAPENGTDFTFAEIKELLGYDQGIYLEIVRFALDWGQGETIALLVCDEEGRLKDLQVNGLATALTSGKVNGHIVGNVLLCSEDQIR